MARRSRKSPKSTVHDFVVEAREALGQDPPEPSAPKKKKRGNSQLGGSTTLERHGREHFVRMSALGRARQGFDHPTRILRETGAKVWVGGDTVDAFIEWLQSFGDDLPVPAQRFLREMQDIFNPGVNTPVKRILTRAEAEMWKKLTAEAEADAEKMDALIQRATEQGRLMDLRNEAYAKMKEGDDEAVDLIVHIDMKLKQLRKELEDESESG